MGKRIRALKQANGSKRRERATALSIVLQGDEPPSEFRIFAAGKVETSKGTFLFDAAAAKSVMADYATQGNELMVDYDHASLAGISLDPAQAGKAAGWFGLEVRNGELWAVNVRWTPGAATALRAKEWRYMSPAFATDEEGRVTSVLNVALTNIPATRNLEPLMAASLITRLGEGMDPKLIAEALDALVAGDSEKCAELLKSLIASAAGAAPAEEPKDPPAEQMAEEPVAPEEKPEEVAAALSAVLSLSGKTSFVASVADIRTWHASHVELAAERKKLADREALLESAERRELGAKLVTAGGMAPARVWANDKADALKPYLAEMPIASLRAYVADALSANPGKGKTDAVAPPTTGDHGLTAEQLQICKETGCEPAVFARLQKMNPTPARS